MTSSDILFQTLPTTIGDIGLITLNRPQKINALTLDMTHSMCVQLKEWATIDSIQAVVVQGMGEKGFCAGGDLRFIYANRHNLEANHTLFKYEYSLNSLIHHFPKPYIALMHGITMGGGVGVSIHASHRIATENLMLSMPETGIGFFPDIGSSYFLNRCPGKTGLYLGLTGNMIGATDAKKCGLIDYIIEQKSLDTFLERLIEKINIHKNIKTAVQETIQAVESLNPPSGTLNLETINIYFSGNTVEAILDSLKNSTDEWAKKTYHTLLKRSPASLKVTFEQLKKGVALNMDECLKMEYKMACKFLEGSEFYEGIRAAVIDKDQAPQWQPDGLEKVTNEELIAYFE